MAIERMRGGNDELKRRYMGQQVWPQRRVIPGRGFRRADNADAAIKRAIERTVRFNLNIEPGIQQSLAQRLDRLAQGFTARDHGKAHRVSKHVSNNVFHVPGREVLKFRIAEIAGEIASAKADEYRWAAGKRAFALERRENLLHLQDGAITFFRRADRVFAEHVPSLAEQPVIAILPRSGYLDCMKRNKNTRDVAEAWNLDTQLVRGGTYRSELGETSEAIYLNSGFCYDSAEVAASRFDGTAPGYVYSRYLNPNLKMLEDRLALVEEAEACIVMGSGMAAVNASMMSFLKTGDHVIAHRVLFGSCHYILTNILPRFGIEVTLIDGTKEENWKGAFKQNTAAVFIETPANPNLEIVDIAMIAGYTKKHGAKLIVDNIFASPLLQKPLKLGADIVVYSTTKHMDGQGRTLGGAVLGEKEFLEKVVMPFHRHTGPALSPFNAWVILKSLETFSLRVGKQCDSAVKIAATLEKQKKIERVIYPGLPSHPQYAIAKKQMLRKGEPCGGTMIAFEVKGGREGAFQCMNALQIIDISNNLGDAKSLLTHPASTTHSNLTPDERKAAGITEGLLRLSIGLEDCDDLERDLITALT